MLLFNQQSTSKNIIKKRLCKLQKQLNKQNYTFFVGAEIYHVFFFFYLHIHTSQANARHNKHPYLLSLLPSHFHPLCLPQLHHSFLSQLSCSLSLMNFLCCMFLSGGLGSRPSVVWRRQGQDGHPAVVYFYPSLRKWETVLGRGAGL